MCVYVCVCMCVHCMYVCMKMTITELRFADDLMATCHSQSLLQDFINRFTKAAKTWGLEVSTTKSKVMIQQSGSPSTPASFFINDNQIEVVPHFQYLGSILSNDATLDNITYFKGC